LNALTRPSGFDIFVCEDVQVRYCHMPCLSRYINNSVYLPHQTIILNPDAQTSTVIGIIVSKIRVPGYNEMLFKLHLIGRAIHIREEFSLEKRYLSYSGGVQMDHEAITTDVQAILREAAGISHDLHAWHFISIASSCVLSEADMAITLQHMGRAFSMLESTDIISHDVTVRKAVVKALREHMCRGPLHEPKQIEQKGP